jgi:hypothetical protein
VDGEGEVAEITKRITEALRRKDYN